MRNRIAQLAVVAVVVTLVAQGVGASVVASQTQAEPPTAPADEVYVQDSGEVVAVYNSPGGAGTANETEFGVSTAENLAYFRMTDPVATTPQVRGNFSAAATRSSLTSQGNLSMPNPQSVESFDLSVDGQRTSNASQFDMNLATTFTSRSMMTQVLRSATTNGTVTLTPDRLTASGSLDVDTGMPVPERNQQSLDATFRETEDGYVLSVDQSQSVNARFNNVPEDEAAAREQLRQQYALMGQVLGGSASVELDSYSASGGSEIVRVEQAYTVRMQGVEQGMERLVRQQLRANQQVSAEQAENFATALGDVQIDEVHVDYQMTSEGVSGTVNVDVRNYGDLVTSTLDIAGSMQTGGSTADQIERFRTTFEARQSADLEQTMTWSGSLTHPSQESIRAQFEAHASSTNWAAYTSELEEQGVPVIDTRFDLQGGIEGDRLTFSGNASMTGEELYQEMFRGLPNASAMDSEAASMLAAFRESRPKKARLVTTYDDSGLRVEAGASFGNLTALREGMSETSSLPPVSEVVGRMNASGGAMHMRVPGALDSQPSESDVRALSYVDSETTIHMPGDWDRSFESMNADRAREFLGAVESSGSGPGFGPIAAIVAVAGAALFLSRRD